MPPPQCQPAAAWERAPARACSCLSWRAFWHAAAVLAGDFAAAVRACVNCAGRRGKRTVPGADAQAGPPLRTGQGLEEAAVRVRGRTG